MNIKIQNTTTWVPAVVCTIQSLLLTSELGLVVTLLVVLLSLFTLVQKKPLSVRILNSLALLTTAILLISINWQQTLSLFTSIMLVAILLKQLQAATKHNYEYVIVLCCFSTPLIFLFHQELIYTLVTISMWLVLFAALNALNNPFNVKLELVKNIRLGLLALPMSVVLLFLLPKFPSFWSMPNQDVTSTGLSDSLDPFDISKLSKEDDIVFRAVWHSAIPGYPLYWRAIVHDQFDGKKWTKSSWQNSPSNLNIVSEASPVLTYSILSEPSGNTWLYGLGWSVSNDRRIVTSPTGTLFLNNPPTKKFEYKVDSFEMPKRNMSSQAQAFYTTVPNLNNPQTAILAADLKNKVPNSVQSSDQIIFLLRDFFRNNEFKYTLEPPVYSTTNSIDTFLFEGKKGFCGHYASATALMLRHAGIPARVVSGYLGGQYNPELGYTIVRQYEAHAWVEYHDGQSWKALDPTAWIAPDRLDGSIFDEPELRNQLLNQLGFNVLGLNPYYFSSFIRDYYETLDYQWTKWVVAFDKDKQSSFFEQWFGPYWNVKTGGLAFGLLSALLAVYFYINHILGFRAVPVPIRLCKQLLKTTQMEDRTPISACNVIKQRYPELATEIDEFSNAFMHYRYDNQAFSRCHVRSAKALIKKIKIKNKSSL